ncbi:MAG: 2-hydroxychromene-2-carboxylate isomerase [Betaproteobacteria bacterium]|nr:2-hydroxychromene-2-carboxylate isomerase [Betaproteobacteria bacterium]MDE2122728.1 2-hydroxychromene-2-carboxylate isomerase [Betaproteobacteria bacterium]MDE2185669.1 2-hydroxychromene-2-carboxylate isomerase [Betaproteobacteria bacterium]MDE2323769.1 2-hydroxychromene-2-carboxylate isomerase [Betaproteobacteria bacterium]
MPVSPITLYFDFTSPYSYLASTRIEALAAKHERGLEWVPILLGPVFAATGVKALVDQPIKGDYALIDIPRSARFLGVPYRHPEPFPVATYQAARVLIGLQREHPDKAAPWVHACFDAYFAHNRNISDMAVLHALARGLELEPTQLDAWCADAQIKAQLKANVDRALQSGVCGAPFFVVDDEPFWGVDRMPQLDAWLTARF